MGAIKNIRKSNMKKDFEKWHKVKSRTQERCSPPSFEEREIWWCSIGANVGVEEDGKSTLFSRPVLIIRKFNAMIFGECRLLLQ